MLACDRSAVFIFWLKIEDGATGLPLGSFDSYSTVIGLDGLPKAMEHGALLGGAADAEGCRFGKYYLFAGFNLIGWTNDGEQNAGAGFFHADGLGKDIQGTYLEEGIVDIADSLGV